MKLVVLFAPGHWVMGYVELWWDKPDLMKKNIYNKYLKNE